MLESRVTPRFLAKEEGDMSLKPMVIEDVVGSVEWVGLSSSTSVLLSLSLSLLVTIQSQISAMQSWMVRVARDLLVGSRGSKDRYSWVSSA